MFPDSIWLQYWYWAVNTPDPLPQINLGFLPLNHLAGLSQPRPWNESITINFFYPLREQPLLAPARWYMLPTLGHKAT